MAKSIFDIPLFDDGIISSQKEDKIKKFRGEDNEIPLSISARDLASYVYSGNTSSYNITLPRITSILNQAKTGDAREQSQLFKMLQDKDPIISAHLQTRKQALQSVEWNITGGESDFKRSEVTKILQGSGIDELIKHLSDAIAIGYSGAGIQWKMGGGDIDGFTFINSDNWIFNEYGDVGLTNYQGSDIVISDKSSPWNDIFIFHKYMLRPGIASEGGLLRTLAQYSFFKAEAIGNFARFMEKYGMPLLTTSINKQDFENSSIRNRVKNALKNFGSDGVAVLAEGSKIENLAGNSAANSPIFTAFIDEMNKNITLAILGQEATSGVAGGMSKGQAQENVRLDLLSGDCKALSETINRQLVSRLEYNKWASSELKFVMNYEPAEDIKVLSEKISAAKSLGFDPPKDWIEEKFKMPLNDAKETFSLGAMPTPTTAPEVAPAIPTISAPEPTASTPTPVSPVATPEAALTTSAGTELTGLNSLRAFADLNTEYASEYNRIIDSANVSEDIKNELRTIAPANSDMIYSVISSKLLDESTTDEERTNLANLRSALSSINIEAIQQRLELDKKREAEIQKAIEESGKIDIQIPKDFLRWKDEEQLAYLNAERKKLESMPDSEQKKNILDELNQLEAQEIGTSTKAEQLEVAPVEPAVIETPDSERRDAVAAEIVSDNANAETQEELPESVYIPSVAEEFRKSTMLEEYKSVVVETGDEDKWKEMFEDKYGVTPDTLEVYTFEDAIDYDNKAMAQIQNEQAEQRIPEQQELIANINLKTDGMPYDVKATVYEKVSKYGTNIDLAIEQAQQEYTLKSQAGLVTTEQPKLDIKQEELNAKLQEAITLSTLGKHNNEEYARKYFDKAIESISDEATKRIAIANKESLWNSFSRARELMVFQRLQAERSTINFDGAFEELNGSPSGTSNSIIKNTMDELLRLPAKTYEAMNRGAEGLIGDFASFSSMFIPSEEFAQWNQNLRAYKNIEEEKFTIEGEENILGSAWYGIAKMAPQILANIAISIPTGGYGSAMFSYMQGAGSTYGSMIDMGIDKRIALGASLVAGIPYAALEKFQLGKAKFITKAGKEVGIDALIPAIAKEVMDKNLSSIGAKTFNELLTKKIENKFKNYAKVLGSKGISYAIDTIEEAVAEGLQDVTMEISEDYAKAINDYANNTALAGDTGYQNWMRTFKNTFVQTLPTMAAMQGVGSVNQASLSRFLKYVKDKKALNNNQANIKTISLEDVDANTKEYLLKNMKFSLENPEYISKPKTKQKMPFSSLNYDILREYLTIFRNANTAVAKEKVTIDFKSTKDMGNKSANATIKDVDDPENGNIKIAIEINKDKITTPEQFIGIMGHEDFVHRFLYGKNSPLSIKEMNKLESIVESFIDKNKSIFPNETEYRTLYKKQGNTDARINQLIREEKLSAFMEKGGFLELIDKESGNVKKEFDPSDIKTNIRDFLSKISSWFRVNMPNVFGGSKDIDILNVLSSAYHQYRYNSPNAKATAEMLKREIINDAKNATVETVIGQSDIDSLGGLLNGLSEVVNKTDIVKDRGDVESINNLISEMNKESDKRMAIIKYNDELDVILENPDIANTSQIASLKSDIENLKAKNPSINKVLGIKSARKHTISFRQWMSDREYSSKMGYKAGIVAEKAEAGKRVSYSKMASDYVDSLNIAKKTKDQLKKDIKSISITKGFTSYANAIDSLMSRAYEKEIMTEYKQMSIDMLAQIPLNIKSEAVNKIESLFSRTLDSEDFSEKSNKIVKIALSKSQGAKDITGLGVGEIFSLTPIQYFKDKFRTERKGERKALKAVELIGADIKSYLNEISASDQVKNKIISGLWGDSVSIKNLDSESRKTTLEDLKNKVDALVVEDEKNIAIEELKNTIKSFDPDNITTALRQAYESKVLPILQDVDFNSNPSKATIASLEASQDWANNPTGDMASMLEELESSSDSWSVLSFEERNAILETMSNAEKAIIATKSNPDMSNIEVGTVPETGASIYMTIDDITKNLARSLSLSRNAILRESVGDIENILENVKKQEDIKNLNIEEIQDLTSKLKSIMSQNKMIKEKRAIARDNKIDKIVSNLENQLYSSDNKMEILDDYRKINISGLDEKDTISEIRRFILDSTALTSDVKDKMIEYIDNKIWMKDIGTLAQIGINEKAQLNTEDILNATYTRLETLIDEATVAPTLARNIFKSIGKVGENRIPFSWTKAGRVPTETLIWELDGRKDSGFWHDYFLDPIYNGENRETLVIKRFAEIMQSTEELYNVFGDGKFNLREIDIPISTLDRKGKALEADIKISENQLVALYLQINSRDNLRYLIENGFVLPNDKSMLPCKLNVDSIITIKNFVESDDRLIGMSRAIKRLFNQNAKFINEVSQRMNGYDIATVQNYYMIATRGGDLQSFMESEDKSTLDKIDITKFVKDTASVTASKILQERKGKDPTAPILLYGATEVAEKHTNMTAKYYGFAEPLRDIKDIFTRKIKKFPSENILNAVKEKYGYGVSNSIANMTNSIEMVMSPEEVDRLYNAITGLIAKGTLSWRTTTLAVQSLGLMTVLNEMPHKYWSPAARLMIVPKYELSKEQEVERANLISRLPSYEYIKERSPLAYKRYELGGFGILPDLVTRHGSLAREVSHITESKNAQKITTVIDKFGDTGMNLIAEADKTVCRCIWYMCELEYMDKFGEIESKTAQDAIVKRFESIVRKTQGSSNITEKSAFQRNKDLASRTAVYLQAQNIKESAYLYKAIISGDFKRIGKTLYVSSASLIAEVALRGLISYLTYNGASAFWSAIGVDKEEKDKEELLKKIFYRGASDRIGILGDVAMAVYEISQGIKQSDWDKIDIPALRPLRPLFDGLGYLTKAALIQGETSNGKNTNVIAGYSKSNYYLAKGLINLSEFFSMTSGSGINNFFSMIALLGNNEEFAKYLGSLNIGYKSIAELIKELEQKRKDLRQKQEELPSKISPEIKENIGATKMPEEKKKTYGLLGGGTLTQDEIDNITNNLVGLNDLMSFADEANPATEQAPTTQSEEKKDAPDSSGIVQRLGRKIFEMKQSRDAINQKLEELKAQIIQYLTGEPVEIAGLGKIFKVAGGVVQVANKEKLKEVLVQILKLKPEQADMIIAKSTTPKEIAEYLKIQSTKVK